MTLPYTSPPGCARSDAVHTRPGMPPPAVPPPSRPPTDHDALGPPKTRTKPRTIAGNAARCGAFSRPRSCSTLLLPNPKTAMSSPASIDASCSSAAGATCCTAAASCWRAAAT
eukprot:7376069-Prymnesium_polylepis.1